KRGQEIYKIGAVTGICNSTIDRTSDESRFSISKCRNGIVNSRSEKSIDMVSTEEKTPSFSVFGDSGAPCLINDGKKLIFVGLLKGGTCDPDYPNDSCYSTCVKYENFIKYYPLEKFNTINSS